MRRKVRIRARTAILAMSLLTAALAQAQEEGPAIRPAGEARERVPSQAAPGVTQSDHWLRSIDAIRADITEPPDETLPEDSSSRLFSRGMVDSTTGLRRGPGCVLMWAPTELCFWPLYFEDVQLERYGQTFSPGFQPVFSGVHFLADFTLVPLKMVFDHPLHCMCTLGYGRPGTPVPCCHGRGLPVRRSPLGVADLPPARQPVTDLARLPATNTY
jgi:hypothetical protein